VDHGGHLFVEGEPALHLVVELALADRGDRGAGFDQPAHELALVVRELRLDEDDVHGALRGDRLRSATREWESDPKP
jgi:hypothetical protein